MSAADEAVAQLATERWRSLLGYAYLLTGSMSDAEDLVQDTLVKLVLRGRAGTDLAAAEAYARQAIRTTFIDGHRRRTRWMRLLPVLHDDPAPGRDPAFVAEADVDVAAALAHLTPRERACVVLRHMDDLSVGETADCLGVSEGSVKRYTSTGMARLEALLGPLGPLDADDGTTSTPVRTTSTRTVTR